MNSVNNQVQFFNNKMRFLNANYDNVRTIESYSSLFKSTISPVEGKLNKDIREFSSNELHDFMNTLPITNIRVKKTIWSLLKCYYNWAIQVDGYLISENPIENLELSDYLIADKLQEKLYYTIEEIDSMCNILENEVGFNAQEIIPIVMARYGILGSELAWIRSLRNEHIDRENYLVHIFDENEEKIITTLPIDDIFIKWVDKALKTTEKIIETDAPNALFPIRKLKYLETGYILKSNRGYKKVSQQGVYSAMHRVFHSIFDYRIRLTKFVNSRKFDLLFERKIINGRITYNDFRDITSMFNPDSKKYTYFSLRDDYIILNGTNDIIDDYDFEKDYLQKKQQV